MEYDYRNMSDRDLVEKAKAGDQLAYRAIYEKHEKTVRARITGYFRWRADVDDVVSESFQKFFSKLDSFDNSRELTPWLVTIANRTALDHLETIRREDEKKENILRKRADSPDDTSEIMTDINPEDEIINTQEHERLMGFIAELDPKYGEVMVKYMVEELEYEEIAKQLSLPLNTVRTRIRRGKEKLAEMMTRGEIL